MLRACATRGAGFSRRGQVLWRQRWCRHFIVRCLSANLLDRVAIGERAGELVMRLRDEDVQLRGNGNRCVVVDGFSVHAATAVAARDRPQLEKLCRYILRPAVCNERMERLADGRVMIRLKSRWHDGTFAKVFEPKDLITKVVALMPAHGSNLLRYHGQLAPAARWRSFVVPAKAVAEVEGGASGMVPAAAESLRGPLRRALGDGGSCVVSSVGASSRSWAALLKRSFP